MIESRPGSLSAVCGVNVTSTEQEAPAAMIEPVQVSVSLNEFEGTWKPTFEIFRGVFPVFFTVTVFTPPVVP